MEFRCLRVDERPQFQTQIVALEQAARYPLGDDFFRLDHGHDYFAFFDRLGAVDYFIGLEDEQVLAVGAGILRQVPHCLGAPPQLAWYLCDLKVHPQAQSRQLSMRILAYAIQRNIQRCDRGYLISMNPTHQPNRLVQVLRRFPLVQFATAVHLGIYALEASLMGEIEPVLRQHRGDLGYLSLGGIKDLRLQSNDRVIPLLHLQWGDIPQSDRDKALTSPQMGYTHMFCVPYPDPLWQYLADRGIRAMATASIVSHQMANNDWRFVLTSDI